MSAYVALAEGRVLLQVIRIVRLIDDAESGLAAAPPTEMNASGSEALYSVKIDSNLLKKRPPIH